MSFAPPGENASDLWFERSNFAGCLLGGVAYGSMHFNLFLPVSDPGHVLAGMHVCVFAIAMYLMTRPKSKKRSLKILHRLYLHALYPWHHSARHQLKVL